MEKVSSGQPPARVNRLRLASLVGGVLALGCLGALAYLVYKEREVLAVYVLAADRRQLLAIGVWYAVDLAIFVGVWASIMERLGASLSFWRHLSFFCAANAAKRLPGTLWYVGGRALLYTRVGTPSRTVILGSAIEGTLTWVAGVAIAVPFLAVALPDRRWLWIGAGAVVLSVMLNPRSIRWLLRRAAKGEELAGIRLEHVYAWLGLYVGGWIVGGALLASVVALFQPVSAGQYPWIVGSWATAGSASMLVTFLPSNFGLTEVALTALLGQIVPAGVAVLVAVGARVLITLLDIVGGGLALASERFLDWH